jgi:hypothetical protein
VPKIVTGEFGLTMHGWFGGLHTLTLVAVVVWAFVIVKATDEDALGLKLASPP